MKTLNYIYESLLDGEDEIFDDTVDAMKKRDIEQFLLKHYTFNGNYDISDKPNKDGKFVVNVHCRILADTNLTTLTNGDFVFGKAEYGFDCWCCGELTSLEGAPEEVIGDFNCRRCVSLTSLKGAPKKTTYFNCSGCSELTSLEGAPKKVDKSFICEYCKKLTSLKGAPKYIGGDFSCEGCGKQFTVEDVKKVSNVKKRIYV